MSTSSIGWNPRYVRYAQVHGRQPGAQLTADDVDHPGGRMTGFMLWIQARWTEWRELRGLPHDHPLGAQDHADFDAWLEEKVG